MAIKINYLNIVKYIQYKTFFPFLCYNMIITKLINEDMDDWMLGKSIFLL
jgi:hypothetical protein